MFCFKEALRKAGPMSTPKVASYLMCPVVEAQSDFAIRAQRRARVIVASIRDLY
jgi:hypothetical protein